MKANLDRSGFTPRSRPRNGNGGARQEDGILITGGAGFIGSNLADRLLGEGRSVLLFDNLSRAGVRRNLEWLLEKHPRRLQVIVADVRDAGAVRTAVRRSSAVFHFAAQVAVTTSLSDPLEDFQVNAGGTLNVLEALRGVDSPPPLVFTSTNKVYGGLDDLTLIESATRYRPSGNGFDSGGIDERRPLDFRSAYGCSKGAADQYVVDYSRTFGLRTVVLRMSCIYGPHQCGTEDQGWVSHVIGSFVEGRPFTVYGNGKQVRDLLYVDDLLEGLLLSLENADRLAGHSFNVGGGPGNTVSLIELLELMASLSGNHPELRFAPWRPGDQKYYVSDTAKFSAATGWRARVDVRSGVERVYRWLKHGPPYGAMRPSSAPATH
jgi:CDP-paratose 2-epimerase